MSRNKKRKGKKTNILLGFICIILVGVLGTILVMSYNTEQEETKRLTELAGNQQSGIEDYEAVKEHAAQLEKHPPKMRIQKMPITVRQRRARRKKTQPGKRMQRILHRQKILLKQKHREQFPVSYAGEMI